MGQRLGQHFLKNEDVIETIIGRLDVQNGETIVEIGPGAGALTLPLAALCKEKKCLLIAIERDSAMVNRLIGELVNQQGIEIITGDALQEIPKLINRLTDQPINYKIVGNIPYYITGSLLRLIGELEHKPSLTVLMIQKEVAKRVSAQPPQMNLLAAATQIWADINILAQVPRKDFTPPPEVDSAVISLRPNSYKLTATSSQAYYACIKAVFKQPRKKLSNNIPQEYLEKAGIAPTLRGQNLSIADLVRLSKIFMV